MEINGIAHIQLTVNDLARAMPFYEEVLGFMGMKAVVKNPEFLYMIGGRSAVAIVRCSPETRRRVRSAPHRPAPRLLSCSLARGRRCSPRVSAQAVGEDRAS